MTVYVCVADTAQYANSAGYKTNSAGHDRLYLRSLCCRPAEFGVIAELSLRLV